MAFKETYESLKKKIDEASFELAMVQLQRKEYIDKASEMREVYEKLVEDKRSVEGQREFMGKIYDTRMDDFKGDVYRNRYLTQLNRIISAYDRVIRGIDDNMDRLNWEIMKVQNDAYSCDGLIGGCEKRINMGKTMIENMFK